MMDYPSYMPEFDVPDGMATGIESKTVGDDVRAILNYEVIEKSEGMVRLKITGIMLKKRSTNV